MAFFDKLKQAIGSKKAGPGRSAAAPGGPEFTTSPELMCGIRPGMTREEIKRHLAILFRRHNRMASSLDQERRNEAELMLEAIVICRQKYVDQE